MEYNGNAVEICRKCFSLRHHHWRKCEPRLFYNTGKVQGLQIGKQFKTQIQEIQKAQTQGEECVMGVGSHMYVFGFEVRVLIDCPTGLPIALKVTKGEFGESRTVR